MCDKIHHFWITSNDHFTKQIYLFSIQKLFGCYTSMIIYIQNSYVFLWVANFLCHTTGFAHLDTFTALTVGIMSNHNLWVFHPRGCLCLLAITPHKFSLQHYSTMRLCWTSSHLTEPTQLNTKRSIDSSTMHTPIECNVPVHMQCNVPLHVISCNMYNECYMDNIIHTTYWMSWKITSPGYDFHTSFHTCQYIMDTYINIYI